MKAIITAIVFLSSAIAWAENEVNVAIQKDAQGKNLVQITEDSAGGVKQVKMVFKTSVTTRSASLKDLYLIMSMGEVILPEGDVFGGCRALQYGQTNFTPYTSGVDLRVYIDGNACDSLVKRLTNGGFQVNYHEARSGIGEDLSPVYINVK